MDGALGTGQGWQGIICTGVVPPSSPTAAETVSQRLSCCPPVCPGSCPVHEVICWARSFPPGLARACSAKYLAWQPSNDRDGGFPARDKIVAFLVGASLLAGFVLFYYLYRLPSVHWPPVCVYMRRWLWWEGWRLTQGRRTSPGSFVMYETEHGQTATDRLLSFCCENQDSVKLSYLL